MSSRDQNSFRLVLRISVANRLRSGGERSKTAGRTIAIFNSTKESKRFVERSKDVSPVRQTDSYRPPWIARSFVPKRMRLPEPSKVLHRRHSMTPLAPQCQFR